MSTLVAKCSGCGVTIGADESALVLRGNNVNKKLTYVCYSCSMKSEEIFFFIRSRGESSSKKF